MTSWRAQGTDADLGVMTWVLSHMPGWQYMVAGCGGGHRTCRATGRGSGTDSFDVTMTESWGVREGDWRTGGLGFPRTIFGEVWYWRRGLRTAPMIAACPAYGNQSYRSPGVKGKHVDISKRLPTVGWRGSGDGRLAGAPTHRACWGDPPAD